MRHRTAKLTLVLLALVAFLVPLWGDPTHTPASFLWSCVPAWDFAFPPRRCPVHGTLLRTDGKSYLTTAGRLVTPPDWRPSDFRDVMPRLFPLSSALPLEASSGVLTTDAFCKVCRDVEASWWTATSPIAWPDFSFNGCGPGIWASPTVSRQSPSRTCPNALIRREVDLLAQGERLEILAAQERLLLVRRLDAAPPSGTGVVPASSLPSWWGFLRIDPLPVVWIPESDVDCTSPVPTAAKPQPYYW